MSRSIRFLAATVGAAAATVALTAGIAAGDGHRDKPAPLHGQTFNLVEEPNRYGIPAFYELHAWAWKDNPTGAHEDWNPQVLCRVPDDGVAPPPT